MMKNNFKEQILKQIEKNNKKPLPYKRLIRLCKVPKEETKNFANLVERMKKKGDIYEYEDGFVTGKTAGIMRAVVTRLNKTYGFVKDMEKGDEFFVAGRLLKGAMPNDIVLIKTFMGRMKKIEAEVVSIHSENFNKFTGIISTFSDYGKKYCIIPDSMPQYELEIVNIDEFQLTKGNKIIAEIAQRGSRHSDHKIKIISNLGNAQKASVCTNAILELNDISSIFPPDVLTNSKEVSDYNSIQKQVKNRLDLRDLDIFTIDGADTKDIDDAIFLTYENNIYNLSVHIADVSFYVKPKSPLDNEALERGTSVYYANKVVPMLPKELSNGICSLNPDEDRLAFSCFMKINEDGELIDYDFKKTVIRSRVKGVYSEVNAILSGNETDEIHKKYQALIPQIMLMEKLAKVLKKCRINRGAPQLESTESKLILDENEFCIDILPRTRGISEEIIEDFMLMANQSAAKFAYKNELPFVYRIHEKPLIDKVSELSATLRKLGVNFVINDEISPTHLANVLEKTRNTELSLIANNLVLRSMSKAKYSPEPLGHFGLVLTDYAHFTSPIRRYPDLSIHRIMSEFINGTPKKEVTKHFQKFVHLSSQASSEAEVKAMKAERECTDCYKAEYMKSYLGEEFEAVITSVMSFGFFVLLENTCEGLVSIESLTDGEYNYDGAIELKSVRGNKVYRIGDKVKVKVIKANVSKGEVDFILV